MRLSFAHRLALTFYKQNNNNTWSIYYKSTVCKLYFNPNTLNLNNNN